jgi:hypothetical protein
MPALRCGLLAAVAALAVAALVADARADARSDQLEDLAVFRSQFLDLDRAYSNTARAQAVERLGALERAAGTTSPEAFAVELCAIAALADNGHTSCTLPEGDGAQIGFTPLDGRYFVTSATPDHAELLGGELTAIDGRPVSVLRAELRKLHGGVAAYRDLFVVKVLVRPDLLHSLGLAAASDAAVYRVRAPDGRTIQQRLERTAASASRTLVPAPDKAPWSLQEPDKLFRWRDAPELDAVVIQLRHNADTKDQRIDVFLFEAEVARLTLHRPNLILDMRQNPGGDFLLTRDLMIGWPKEVGPAGKIFVLVGPETFSAGIVSTAYLKQAGGERVVLVGAPPGDRLTFFAEGSTATLPHSGLRLLPAPERDDLADGCRPYQDCFGALAQPGSPTGSKGAKQAILDWGFGRKPLAVRSLDPEIPAPWTIQDYLAGRDPAMEALRRRFGERAR